MADFGAGFVCVILVLCFTVPSLATDYTVGDSAGWKLGIDYSTWSSGKTFKVGDYIVFNYGNGHTVNEVTPNDYQTCALNNVKSTDNSGHTTIALKTAGTHYFICSFPGHCEGGMKLAVPVEAGGSTTTPPPGSLTPPSGSTITPPRSTTTPPGTPTTGTTTTTPPGIPTTGTTLPPCGRTPYLTISSSGTLSPFVGVMITLVPLWFVEFLISLAP